LHVTGSVIFTCVVEYVVTGTYGSWWLTICCVDGKKHTVISYTTQQDVNINKNDKCYVAQKYL
jgi:hypothetical protein